jgi:peptidoglycan/LPS O-acetylase OafA/YrhL
VNEDVLRALASTPPDEPRGHPSRASVLRVVALVAVPVAAAALAAVVHGDFRELLWPPSPVLALAPIGSYLAIVRVAATRVEAVLTVVVAAFVALLASWAIAVVLGAAALLECLEPNGGCIPW